MNRVITVVSFIIFTLPKQSKVIITPKSEKINLHKFLSRVIGVMIDAMQNELDRSEPIKKLSKTSKTDHKVLVLIGP